VATPHTAEDTERYRWMVRNTVLVALALTVLSEAAHYVAPQFPKDTVGSGVMAGTFAVVALACHLRAARLVVTTLNVAMFVVIGWWIARTVGKSGGIGSLHRDAVYAVLAGAHALLLFSAVEFTLVTGLFTASFIATSIYRGDGALGDYTLTIFYVFAFYCMAQVGIYNRTRLQRSERQARAALEALNKNLEAEVAAQIERIRRAEQLGRYLPPELSEHVLAGEEQPVLAHGRRNIAVLCANPFGFLEGLTQLDSDQVPPVVNGFVSELTRVAFNHGGVIERFVGPRITVLFGALAAEPPAGSVRRAVAMAAEVQQVCHVLLRQWEAAGHAGVRLRMAIGITSGVAVVGSFGSERRVEYTALGEAVVRAHRLATVAIPGEVRADEAAATLLDDQRLAPGEPVEFSPGVAERTYLIAGETAGAELVAEPMSAALGATVQQPAAGLGATMEQPAPALAATIDGAGDSRPSASDSHRITTLPVLREGTLFDGRYRIEAQAGRGGMAVVYRARHLALDELRAIKLLSPDRLAAPGAVEQFRREAEATARIQHPNVVRLHDFGRSVEGLYYLALDFVDGSSLAEIMTAQRLPLDRVVAIAGDVLSALQAAHELRLVHRDLKPGNVLIDGRGGHVTDFGMVQPLHGGLDPHGDLIVGTPAYMSPEQCRGRPLDGRSDLYSFGVMFYEMVTGALPYRDTRAGAIATAAADQEIVPIRERAPDLPRALVEVIEECLHKDPAERPRSALAVKQRLSLAGERATG